MWPLSYGPRDKVPLHGPEVVAMKTKMLLGVAAVAALASIALYQVDLKAG